MSCSDTGESAVSSAAGGGGDSAGVAGSPAGAGGSSAGNVSAGGTGGAPTTPTTMPCSADAECFAGLACLDKECPPAPTDPSRYITWAVSGTEVEQPFSGACSTPEATTLNEGGVVIACAHGDGLYDWRLRLLLGQPKVGMLEIGPRENGDVPAASMEFGGGQLGQKIFHSSDLKVGQVVIEEFVPNGRIQGRFLADRLSGNYVVSGAFSLITAP